jgi:hypothetical protein
MKVSIHIGQLVLDGFTLTARQGRQVQAVVERELARLLAGSGESGNQTDEGIIGPPQINRALPALMQSGGSLPSATAGPFHPPSNANPSQLGHHIARSVFGGIGNAK